MKIALIRGKFLNKSDMQSFEPLYPKYFLTAYGSLQPFDSQFKFPCNKLPSPMDLPDFPYKMSILNRLFIDAHYLFGLEKKLRGYDIAHTAETYFHFTQQCLNAKRMGYIKKVIVSTYENIPFNNEGIWGRKGFKGRVRQETDHFIAISQKAKEVLLAEGVEPNKISVIGHGIDTQRFKPNSNRKNTGKPLTILFVGRLETAKGVGDVINAFRNILSDLKINKPIRLLLVGDGTQKEQIINQLKDWGIEKFVNIFQVPYDQIHKVYQEADIFVAPSKETATWQEQYNIALLEAQASGLPIVTTNTGSILENVGDAALVVPSGNIHAITEALKSLILSNPKRIIYGEKARKRAERIHDIKVISKQIEKVYQNILSSCV